jgi:phosphatidate cytidylyltransferase
MKRVATAFVLLFVVWVVCRHAPPAGFAGVVSLVAAGAAWEAFRLLERTGARPFRLLGVAAVVVACWSFSTTTRAWLDPAATVLAASLAATALALWRREAPGPMLQAALTTVFPVALIGLGLGTLIGLRDDASGRGVSLVVLLIVCVVASDTAAYYVGRAFGRSRLAPVVSPGKTWAGLWGGLAASALAGVAARYSFFQDLTVAHAVAVGALIGMTGVLGDLAESMIKRAAGAKDSSSLLPGHGGLLDRIDSLLFAAPVLYYYSRLVVWGSS